MNIVLPEYLKLLALAYNTTPAQNKIAGYKSDSCPIWLKDQPGVSADNLNLTLPSLEQNDSANLFQTELNDNQLTLILNANNQIHYIFITDNLGKIWYENEVDQFQQILKINIDLLPNGTYNILIENDGLFSAKRFVKVK